MSKEEVALAPGEATCAGKAMASSLTPTKKSSNSVSTVFFTPPVSMERKRALQPPPKIPPLPDPAAEISPLFPTPEATPSLSPPPSQLRSRAKLTLGKGEDVVSGLYNGGYILLTRRVLDHLEPADLYNATLVCRRWSQLTASFPHIPTKLREYSKQLHRDTENKDKPYPALALCSDRKPLGDAKNRLLSVKHAPGATPSLPTKTAMVIPKRVMYKHRHCPQCRARSKQLNLRRAECTKCRFDFCSSCFKSWHDDGECERQRSPKRPSKEISAGSKRSKKNLRRL